MSVIAWQRTGEPEHIQVGYQVLQRKKYIKGSGDSKEVVVTGREGSEAAFVIALTPENRVVIARQFRCGPEKVLDELPGGFVDPGETALIAAGRELKEEVGYASDSFEFIGTAYKDAWDALTRHYFIAYDCYRVESHNPDLDEEIEPVLISIGELFANARNQNMVDVAGLFFAYDTLKALEES